MMAEYENKESQTADAGANDTLPPESKSASTERKSRRDEMEHDEKQQEKKPRKSRKWVILFIFALIIVVGLIVGIPYYLYRISHAKTDDAFIDAHVTSLSSRVPGHVWKLYVNDNQLVKKGDLIAELDPRDFQTKVEQARAALSTAESQSESAGINVSLTDTTSYASLADAGAAVELARSAVNTSSARLASAKSELSQSLADVNVAESSLQQIRAEVKAMQAVYEKDLTDLKRYQQMYDANSVTKQQLDHAIAATKVSNADLDAARKQVAVAQARVAQAQSAVQTARDKVTEQESLHAEAQASLKEAQARLAAAKAAPQKVAYSKSQLKTAGSQVEQARTALRQAELELSYVKICAPISGRATHKTVEPGDYIVQGQTLLAIVPEDIYITANYKETDLTHMRPGQPVTISVDAYPGVTFGGHVDSIQAGSGAQFSLLPPENATGNYIKVVQRIPVKIVFNEQPDPNKYYIVPGMSVIPEVDMKEPPQTPKGEKKKPPYVSWIAPPGTEDVNSPTTPAKIDLSDGAAGPGQQNK
ncbi:MAG: efflux RND transporter periplasmic adaptor subunit [Sedimentisphaerales bacterium]